MFHNYSKTFINGINFSLPLAFPLNSFETICSFTVLLWMFYTECFVLKKFKLIISILSSNSTLYEFAYSSKNNKMLKFFRFRHFLDLRNLCYFSSMHQSIAFNQNFVKNINILTFFLELCLWSLFILNVWYLIYKLL